MDAGYFGELIRRVLPAYWWVLHSFFLRLKTIVEKIIMNSIQSTAPEVPAKKEKVKKVRTDEQIAADKERMARLRAMRGKNKVDGAVTQVPPLWGAFPILFFSQSQNKWFLATTAGGTSTKTKSRESYYATAVIGSARDAFR